MYNTYACYTDLEYDPHNTKAREDNLKLIKSAGYDSEVKDDKYP